MQELLRITLSFDGRDADSHRIEFYDVAQALIGFQRSLALTTHLVINDQIITQAPALKGARIFAAPPDAGSWKMTAVVSMIATGIYQLGTVPKDTVLGHILFSVYDYVVSETLGVPVDFNKSLGQLYKEAKAQKLDVPRISESQADSLVEKCSTAIREMHRPIYKTATAARGTLEGTLVGKSLPVRRSLSMETYEYMQETFVENMPIEVVGRVSSYNSNTFKGRLFAFTEGRPVSFELSKAARSRKSLDLVTSSLRAHALKDRSGQGLITFRALRATSRSGHLKSYVVLEVLSGD